VRALLSHRRALRRASTWAVPAQPRDHRMPQLALLHASTQASTTSTQASMTLATGSPELSRTCQAGKGKLDWSASGGDRSLARALHRVCACAHNARGPGAAAHDADVARASSTQHEKNDCARRRHPP
jgi:hypothetical protein